MTWLYSNTGSNTQKDEHLLNLDSLDSVYTVMYDVGGDILYCTASAKEGCIYTSDNQEEIRFVYQKIKQAISEGVRVVSLSTLIDEYESEKIAPYERCLNCQKWLVGYSESPSGWCVNKGCPASINGHCDGWGMAQPCTDCGEWLVSEIWPVGRCRTFQQQPCGRWRPKQ